MGLSATSPSFEGSETHEVLLRTGFFGRPAPFWLLLTSDGLHLADFIDDWVYLPPLKTTCCIGRHSSGVVGRDDLKVLAIRTYFRSARFFNAGFCTSDHGWCSR